MRKLRIAQIAPLWFPIPPKKYGGTERIISFLTEGLVKKGHKVTLFAAGGSKTKANLKTVIEKDLFSLSSGWIKGDFYNLFNHAFAFEQAKKFDIIHCHWNMMGSFFQPLVKTPSLHTMHNVPPLDPKNFSYRTWKILNHYGRKLNLIFVSKSEQKNAQKKLKGAKSWVIYNGIDLAGFKFNQNPEKHFIWVGRVCNAKGPDLAIKIVQKTNKKLLLAGQIQDKHEDYFEQKIKPLLDKDIKYVGEFSTEKLANFYASSKALIYPIRWEEPFGLVMAEAMACGTPVIVFNHGSAKEVVKNGKTGFVVDNVSEAVKAIKKIDQIKREDCRKLVEDNFTIEKMVDEYEKVYYEIIAKSKNK